MTRFDRRDASDHANTRHCEVDEGSESDLVVGRESRRGVVYAEEPNGNRGGISILSI